LKYRHAGSRSDGDRNGTSPHRYRGRLHRVVGGRVDHRDSADRDIIGDIARFRRPTDAMAVRCRCRVRIYRSESRLAPQRSAPCRRASIHRASLIRTHQHAGCQPAAVRHASRQALSFASTNGIVCQGCWPSMSCSWLIQVPAHGVTTFASSRSPGPATRGGVAITGSGPSSRGARAMRARVTGKVLAIYPIRRNFLSCGDNYIGHLEKYPFRGACKSDSENL
jgi:hypothetical protein